MRRYSLVTLVYVVAGVAGYFALVVAAQNHPGVPVAWLAQSLGFLYGTILYVTGFAAFYMACGAISKASSSSDIASAIPISLLPALVGVVGMVHGYISVYHTLSVSGTTAKPISLYVANATILTSAMVGLCTTLPSFAILAVALATRRFRQKPEQSD